MITRREKIIRRLIRSLVGKHVIDGGQRGTLVRCHECGGNGLLHKLDAAELAAMAQRARDTSPEGS